MHCETKHYKICLLVCKMILHILHAMLQKYVTKMDSVT